MPGVCFLMPNQLTSGEEISHLHFLLTGALEIERGSKEVLVASISSWKGTQQDDPGCILVAGDHQRVKHKSYVVYSKSEICSVSTLIAKQKTGIIQPQGVLRTELFDQIIVGLFKSDRTPQKCQSFFQLANPGYSPTSNM
jgi:hypothetical protein